MFGANVEVIADDETHVLLRISWFANGEYYEKWITRSKDDDEVP